MSNYTVREFIRLTPPQKLRLQQRDPEQYKKLKELSEKTWPVESDPQAGQEVKGK